MISRYVSKWMRGIAILMVIFSHYAGWMFVEARFPELRDWMVTWGVYGVDIFFALSGYGLVKSAEKGGITKKFVWKRFKSTYLPYFFIVGGILLADGVFDDLSDILSFLTGQDFWFMAVLFMVYTIFMICYRIGKWKELTCFMGVLIYTCYLYKNNYAYFWIVSNMTFMTGVFIATIEPFLKEKKYQWILLAAGILGTLYFSQKYQALGLPVMNTLKEAILLEIGLSLFFSLMIMAVAMLVPQKKGKFILTEMLSFLGKYSLYIYLLHTRVFYFFMFRLTGVTYYERVLIVVFVTILLAWLIAVFFENGVDKIENYVKEKYQKKFTEENEGER